jgi:hypothetical protein
MHFSARKSAAFCVILLLTATTHAGFSGQTLLGPLGPGSSVSSSTVGHADENDGFTSGDHFFDIWGGPDDVYQLNWPGGPMTLTMTYNPSVVDLDFFLFEPDSLDDSSNYGITNLSPEIIVAPVAPAGIYYINIDSEAVGGDYVLSVSALPEPAALGLAALAGPILGRRRRA